MDTSADGHLACFYFLAVMNNAAVNISMKFVCERIFSPDG